MMGLLVVFVLVDGDDEDEKDIVGISFLFEVEGGRWKWGVFKERDNFEGKCGIFQVLDFSLQKLRNLNGLF